jgi:alkylation response protein AidB-like acyl-CoA dehydrogenase
MKPFKAPVEDILYSLEHVADARRIPDWNSELATEIIRHFAAFAENEIAPLDEIGDRQGCRLTDGRVRMPDGFKEVYCAYVDQGWPGLTAPVAFGGQGINVAVHAGVSEIFTGACHSLQMVTGLVPGAIRTLLHFGTDDQQRRLIPPLASGEWLATMCLTESGAGSDLSRIRTKAERYGDHWRISGEKIFISGGDQDLSVGILHLVLARTGEDGTKGLSLFACQDDKTRIQVARIEDKLGLHASPTCQLVFDDAEAELLGGEGQGLLAMFTLMNHARLDVALQGVAHAARAHDIASAYAAERIQGRDAQGQPVTLDHHADIRRMLTEIRELAMTSRAMAHTALVEMAAGGDPDLVDFLTPVVKVGCTEAGIRAADLGIQVLGGYGYLKEYRLEQTWRDARITAIYEGANGIHALTLASRLLRHKNGAAANAFERWLDAEDQTKILEGWRRKRTDLAIMSDPNEAAMAFMQQTIDAYRQAVAGGLRSID